MITRSNAAGRASKRPASPVDGQFAAPGDTAAGSSMPPKRVRRTAPLASTTKVEVSIHAIPLQCTDTDQLL